MLLPALIQKFNSLNKLEKLMLQAMIYYIVTVILTKELVKATDNCTEYQFKTPFSYVGQSCEDIYNKNIKIHKWPGYCITPLHTRFTME